MPTTKKTVSEKISDTISNLNIVSEQRAKIETVAASVANVPDAHAFILATSQRYDADIAYLRSKIVRLAAKSAEKMSVEQFARFASSLSKIVS